MKKFLLAIVTLLAVVALCVSTTKETTASMGNYYKTDFDCPSGDCCPSMGQGCLSPVIIIGGPIHTGN
ncbi:hypothetical protein [Hugenholtzia roseola]|uniref:hypothetical protein n=1 Tax=Hugenholtzia roseola TaxID=1002 RepID=UPI0012B5AFAD|nr:hypothetical protein [Hugenholtzia roseola]